MSTTERRTRTAEPIELRTEGGRRVATGYAYRFGTYSQNLGGFVEVIDPGAGARSIVENDIRALYNHDANLLLGRSTAGTLRLHEDDAGGYYEIDLPNTRTGDEVAELLERGDLNGSSFGFRTISDEWGDTEQGYPLRRLKAFELVDVGPVTFPAYLDTSSALRSLAEARSLDLADVRSAAEANTLAAVLNGETDNQHRKSDSAKRIATTRNRWLLG